MNGKEELQNDVRHSASTSRNKLAHGSVALVEDASSDGMSLENSSGGFSPDFQVAFPYRGMLVWHVGRDDVAGDANQVLFVTGGESYRVSEPVPGGYRELIITPAPDVLSEIANVAESRLSSHPLFRRRS